MNIESFITQKKPKRAKKGKTKTEERKKNVDNVVKHEKPKDFDKA
jgi:hypothetical protein